MINQIQIKYMYFGDRKSAQILPTVAGLGWDFWLKDGSLISSRQKKAYKYGGSIVTQRKPKKNNQKFSSQYIKFSIFCFIYLQGFPHNNT